MARSKSKHTRTKMHTRQKYRAWLKRRKAERKAAMPKASPKAAPVKPPAGKK